MALAKVEAAYKDEKQTMVLIEEIVELCSRYDLKDALDADENATDENRLLPAMNKIWPFLVSCFRSGNQLVSVSLLHLVILWKPVFLYIVILLYLVFVS